MATAAKQAPTNERIVQLLEEVRAQLAELTRQLKTK